MIHHIIPIILEKRGGPQYLINRIIKAVLNERTTIQWSGQTTPMKSNYRGVKQGRLLLPMLFIIVLDEVMQEWLNAIKKDSEAR